MNCPDLIIKLPDYHLGRLSNDENKIIDEHLSNCKSCKALAAQIQDTLKYIHDEKQWEPDSSYWNNLLPQIHKRIQKKETRFEIQKILHIILPAAAAILIGILLLDMPEFQPLSNSTLLAMNLNSIPVAELSEYYSVQSLIAENNILLVDTSVNVQAADSDLVKELVSKNKHNIAATYLDDIDLYDAISNEDGTLIVSALQK
jgi:hypothetical protein